MTTLYGDFSKVDENEAVGICTSLKNGDAIILSEGVLNAMLENYEAQCRFTKGVGAYPSGRDLDCLYTRKFGLVGNGNKVRMIEMDCEDFSFKVAPLHGAYDSETYVWISWGIVDFVETAVENGIEWHGQYWDKLGVKQEKQEKQEETTKLPTRVKELESQLEATGNVIDLLCIEDGVNRVSETFRGSIWTRDGDECVLVQICSNEQLLIALPSYNRYDDIRYHREGLVRNLIKDGWQLKSLIQESCQCLRNVGSESMVKNFALVCKNNEISNLTKGRTYKVIDIQDFGYIVINDNGEEQLVAFKQIANNCRMVRLYNIGERFWEER